MSAHIPAGFLNIDKPLHHTSHDVVAAVRRRCRAMAGPLKVGHAGTLDPLADGVLVICLGAATRLSEYIMAGRKLYRAQITLGTATSSYDAEGDIISRRDASHISRAHIDTVLPRFIGSISQTPPMYSAIKYKGQKLYELARQGKTVALPQRKVTIHQIDIIHFQNPTLELEITCEAGTYIRSIAHDLGEALNVGAFLSGLTRLASGGFNISESIQLASVNESDNWVQHLVTPYEALSDFVRVMLTEEESGRIRHGGFIPRRLDKQASPVFAFDRCQQLVAILEPRDSNWKPRKVFPSRT